MSIINENTGQIPLWLQASLDDKKDQRQRIEIEIKLIIPKEIAFKILNEKNAVKHEIEQLYLTEKIVNLFADRLGVQNANEFDEWRIRRKDQNCYFTAKRSIKGGGGAQRTEYEIVIDSSLFAELKKNLSFQDEKPLQILKTRYDFLTYLADEEVLVEIDDYHATGKGSKELDFVSCEIEVPRIELANILQKGNYFAPSLQFLKQGLDVTGIKSFSNRVLAEHGFIKDSYNEILDWLVQRYLTDLQNAVVHLEEGDTEQGIQQGKQALLKIQSLYQRPNSLLDAGDIRLTQDVLVDLAFKVEDSLGRKDESNPDLKKIDVLGKGWLRDYHQIISANFYIRLHSKPQVFRPGRGNANTTTRGAHTSDVTAASIQLARQLGLNSELCMAAAAMHDVGHPAGGHIGEEILYEFSQRQFNHHIFSLSLVEMFGLNILKEVQLCAFYHKSGGKKLMAPDGKPQEFGIVRIADKLAYTAWDLFDSIANGYFPKEEVPGHIFDILGFDSMSWMNTMVQACVRESASAHRVQFSEQSGDVYKAYKEARDLVYTKVHPEIDWSTLRAQLGMCYQWVSDAFPDLDPVPIVAYMTDIEVSNLAKDLEGLPKKSKISIEVLKDRGYGFVELIEIMRHEKFDPSTLYYTSSREVTIL